MLGALAVLVVVVAAKKAAPHLRRWWSGQAIPFLEGWSRGLLKGRRAKGPVVAAQGSTLARAAPTESSQEAAVALEEYRASMSSAEARERFVAALVARLFSEGQLQVLRNSRIEDEASVLELASALETLTPDQLGESLTLILEANPSWPDKEMLAEIGSTLGRHGRGDGEYVRVNGGRINTALGPPPSLK